MVRLSTGAKLTVESHFHVSFQSLSPTACGLSIKYHRRNHIVELVDYTKWVPDWEARRQRRAPTCGYVTAVSPSPACNADPCSHGYKSESAFLWDSILDHSGSWSSQVQKHQPIHLSISALKLDLLLESWAFYPVDLPLHARQDSFPLRGWPYSNLLKVKDTKTTSSERMPLTTQPLLTLGEGTWTYRRSCEYLVCASCVLCVDAYRLAETLRHTFLVTPKGKIQWDRSSL